MLGWSTLFSIEIWMGPSSSAHIPQTESRTTEGDEPEYMDWKSIATGGSIRPQGVTEAKPEWGARKGETGHRFITALGAVTMIPYYKTKAVGRTMAPHTILVRNGRGQEP